MVLYYIIYCQAQAADELSSCMAVIRLLVLQTQLLKQSASRVVNLSHDEAAAFVRASTKYSEVSCSCLFYIVVNYFICLLILIN